MAACLAASPGSLLAAKPSNKRPGQYKRVHQKALKQVLGGEAAAAIKQLRQFEQAHGHDAETKFMLALALAREGQVADARVSADRAVELGLPIGRLVAGPQPLLDPIAEHVRRRLTDHQDRFAAAVVHGPMLGRVTHDSAGIWLRVVPGTRVRIQVFESGGRAAGQGLGDARSVSEWTEPKQDTDHTTVLTVGGLKPDQRYLYRVQFKVAGEAEGHGGTHGLRTSPASGAASAFRIAFGGGAGYVPHNERVWNTITAQRPQALVLLGDNVYSDDPTSTAMQQYCYYRRQSRPEWATLVASTPVYAIWDDHDFGTNDCIGGVAIDEPKWKPAVWRTFRQNWVNPAYGGGEKQPGVWFDTYRGDVHLIFLDGRCYRTSQKHQPRPSMLGPAQMAWLKRTLAGSKGTFKVLCSPVPWTFKAKGSSKDTWNGFREERGEIFDLIRDKRVEGVVLMSADRHRSDAWRIKHPGLYDLYEFNSSRLTNQHVHGTMKEAIFSYNKKQSFGLVDFDTTATDPSATYRVVTIDGERVHRLVVRRSQLRQPG